MMYNITLKTGENYDVTLKQMKALDAKGLIDENSVYQIESEEAKSVSAPPVPESFGAYYNEKIDPNASQSFDQSRTTPEQARAIWKSKLEESWSDPETRKQFALYNRDKLKTPTIEQWRSMPFDEKVRSYSLNSGQSIADSKEMLSGAPSTAEGEMFGQSGGKQVGSMVKDMATLSGRGLLGLRNFATGQNPLSGMNTTGDTSNGLVEGVLTDPMLPFIPATMGGATALSGLASNTPALGGLLGGQVMKQGFQGGLYGLGTAGFDAFRPEGITTNEALSDIGLGFLSDFGMGFGGKIIRGIPDKLAKANVQVANPKQGVKLLEYGANPENRMLMAENFGKSQELGEDVFKAVMNPDVFASSEMANMALEKMPPISGDDIYKAFKDASPDLTELSVLEKKKAVGYINKWLNDLRPQLIGKEISPIEMRKFRQQLDQLIDYEKMPNGQAIEALMENMVKKGRYKIKTSLIESAEQSGNSSYVTAMEDMTRKYDIVDQLKEDMPKNLTKKKMAGSWINQIENEAKTYRQNALADFDKEFGTNFYKRAEAVSNANKLGVGPDGVPTSASMVGTGKALSPSAFGAKGAGEALPFLSKADGLTTIPNIGAIATQQGPNLGASQSTTKALSNLFLGDEERYNQGFK